jgi:hypothetical protein
MEELRALVFMTLGAKSISPRPCIWRHNECSMRRFLVLAIMTILGPMSSAEVIRCADAAGNVSYTDSACPAGARQLGRVSVPEAAIQARDEADRHWQEQNMDAGRASPLHREPTEAAARPSQAPAGPVIIDSRGSGSNSSGRAGDSRWSERGDDPTVADYGYPYPGAYRQPMPPRDMRPRIRNCDETGCRDTLGNHYNRSGQLDRYQGLDGKNCRPVGTTTICR